MSRMEVYSPEGLRMDGRRWNELRQFSCQTNTHPNASDGSSYVRQGNTVVLCLVKGPMDTNRATSAIRASAEGPVLNINISYPPFAGVERKKRSKNERRFAELSIVLERCFLKTIVLKNYSRTVIEVNLTLLSFDGGLLAACCNSITLALIDAGISLYDYVSAVSVGIYSETALLDLNSLEESDLSYVTIGVVGDSDKLNLIMCEDRLPLDKLERLINLGIQGCHQLRELMNETVKEVGIELLSKRQ